MAAEYKFETLQLYAGQEMPDVATDARAVPICRTTSYIFRNSAHAQARFNLQDAALATYIREILLLINL